MHNGISSSTTIRGWISELAGLSLFTAHLHASHLVSHGFMWYVSTTIARLQSSPVDHASPLLIDCGPIAQRPKRLQRIPKTNPMMNPMDLRPLNPFHHMAFRRI